MQSIGGVPRLMLIVFDIRQNVLDDMVVECCSPSAEPVEVVVVVAVPPHLVRNAVRVPFAARVVVTCSHAWRSWRSWRSYADRPEMER